MDMLLSNQFTQILKLYVNFMLENYVFLVCNCCVLFPVNVWVEKQIFLIHKYINIL